MKTHAMNALAAAVANAIAGNDARVEELDFDTYLKALEGKMEVEEVEEVRCAVQIADLVAQFALERRDVETQFVAPVIHAVPVERAALRLEPRLELGHGRLVIEAARCTPAARQHLEPEQVVEMQVEHGAVHVETHPVDAGPVGDWKRGHRRRASGRRKQVGGTGMIRPSITRR